MNILKVQRWFCIHNYIYFITKILLLRWDESVIQQVYKIQNLAAIYEPKQGENHVAMSLTKRKELGYNILGTFHSIEDYTMFPSPNLQPIIFEEICIKDTVDNDVRGEAG